MRRFILGIFITAAALVGVATAQNLIIDDSSFDYSDTDIETAYLDMQRTDAGDLVILFSDTDMGSVLPSVAVTVPDAAGTDIFGDDRTADAADIDEVDFLAAGNVGLAFQVTHEDTLVRDVSEAYLEALAGLGFTATPISETTNLRVVELDDGQLQLRAVFRNVGAGDVTARITKE